MDGRVVTFAPGFVKNERGLFDSFDAVGSFELSASRNAVVVHKAEITTDEQLDLLLRALGTARKEMLFLQRFDGRPPDDNQENVREVKP